MNWKNTQDRYGIVMMMFHWLMAVLVLGMLALGLYMTSQPITPENLKLYGWHKQTGILILGLVALRFAWRLGQIIPRLPDTMPQWEKIAAKSTHWALYIFMILLPITGWLMSSAAGFPVSFFGLFVLPDLISPSEPTKHLLEEVHEWLAYGLIALLCLHVLAALKHHFYDKDNVLSRML